MYTVNGVSYESHEMSHDNDRPAKATSDLLNCAVVQEW